MVKERTRKSLTALALALLFCTLCGCTTTIPSTDTQPPTVTLLITGPGFRYQCGAGGTLPCPDTPRLSDTGYLRDVIFIPRSSFGDGIVTLTVVVGDQGGVEEAGLILSTQGYTILEKPDSVLVEDRAQRVFHISGNRTDPRTGLSFTIKILLDAAAVGPPHGGGILVSAYGRDFGGAAGTPNSTNTSDRYVQPLAF